MNTFRTLYGKPIENIISYITEYIKERSDIEILIGTDSQSYSNVETVFGVAIALYTHQVEVHMYYVQEKLFLLKETYQTDS